MNAIKLAARSLIFTSGTLTPLAAYAKELNMTFPIGTISRFFS
jgi:Rad3-related DNA helicase